MLNNPHRGKGEAWETLTVIISFLRERVFVQEQGQQILLHNLHFLHQFFVSPPTTELLYAGQHKNAKTF